MKDVLCNKCGQPMKNLGNISGMVYTSYPVQWDDTYVCEFCKERKTVRECGSREFDNTYVLQYPEQH